MGFPLLAVLLSSPLLAADRPTPLPGQALRSEAVAVNGMVCASHPLAAQIGLDVLKAGGNAVDAAIATSAAMGLMEPTSCGTARPTCSCRSYRSPAGGTWR